MNHKQPVRNHIFHEITRSLCPQCRQVINAQVILRENAVFLRKYCPEHGWSEALVSSDAANYLASDKYNKPGAIPYQFATEVKRGCPLDCGLCPEHQQHTCVAVFEITSRCNLACPVCFADAGKGFDLSLPQIEFMLERLLEMEKHPEVVQISGGEPTVHPHLIEILATLQNRGIRYVMLNTNGLRLAQDKEFVRQLASYHPAIYLQFDGLHPETYQELRGRDLLAIKRQALDNLHEARLYAVLVATLVKDVNEHEIGDILRFGLDHPAVLGVSYQPATFAGRCMDHHNPLNRLTLPDVLQEVESQSAGIFRASDFRPVPCPHPTCSASTYAFVDGKQVIPIPRLIEVDDYLDFVTNRTVPDISTELQPLLEALWSMAAVMGSDKTTQDLTCVACDISIPVAFSDQINKENFFLIHVHGFMDEYNFDVKRVMKCCIHEMLPDGRAIPFCAYNTLGYREQLKQSLEV
jgi:uncharacterized radical SAM superfamily Fe-S cluster-containing enzyme